MKTRLQVELSPGAACAVHMELVALTARQLLAAALGPVEIWVDQSGEHALIADCLQLGMAGRRLQPQGANLGVRMLAALEDGLSRYERVILVGSDCPGLDPDYLRAAATALENRDLVLGPSDDGGYVLIGCRRVHPGVFAGVAWGGDQVLEQTLQRLQSLNLSVGLLPERYDVDTPSDLRRWRNSC